VGERRRASKQCVTEAAGDETQKQRRNGRGGLHDEIMKSANVRGEGTQKRSFWAVPSTEVLAALATKGATTVSFLDVLRQPLLQW